MSFGTEESYFRVRDCLLKLDGIGECTYDIEKCLIVCRHDGR
jgi:hypothetical protein